MERPLQEYSKRARRAVEARDWPTVQACAGEILRRDGRSAEGHFLQGLLEKARRRPAAAQAAFRHALDLDHGRYDAAMELAALLIASGRSVEAVRLLEAHEGQLGNSPRYLDAAGLAYTKLGLHDRAWSAYEKANTLQPGVPSLQAHLAACAVYVGRIEEARTIYRSLLQRAPDHQRNHYELSQLERARDRGHVEQMLDVLRRTRLPPERNIFLYYALGKELEDLGEWGEAFRYYRMAGDAATSVSPYRVSEDVEVIDTVIATCSPEWLASGAVVSSAQGSPGTPVFIVGLPRTGTTLTDRILASHSLVESIGETFLVPATLHRLAGHPASDRMTAATIEQAAQRDVAEIARGYLEGVSYRLGGRPFFIDKLPENFLYLGFIAAAFPDARLVYLRRHPMDACFAMYKQAFFRFAYNLDDLGQYYLAHMRLLEHWRHVLGNRLVEIPYESLVEDPGTEIRRLLQGLGLVFEPGCLEFDRTPGAVATASSAQVREKIHTRSVGRWRRFEAELRPLRDMLEAAGITIG